MMTEQQIKELFPLRSMVILWVLVGLTTWGLTAYPIVTWWDKLSIGGAVVLWICLGAITVGVWKIQVVPRSRPAPPTFPHGFDHRASLARHEYMMRIYNPARKYVYVIRDVDVTGYCKIGRSSALTGRLMEFGVKLPFNIHVVTLLPCDDEVALENFLHRTLRHRRIRGEWFNLDHIDIAWLTADNGLSAELYTITATDTSSNRQQHGD